MKDLDKLEKDGKVLIQKEGNDGFMDDQFINKKTS